MIFPFFQVEGRGPQLASSLGGGLLPPPKPKPPPFKPVSAAACLFLPKTCRDCISSARKSYQEDSSVIFLYAVRIWKGDLLVANIEELEKMDASEIHAKRLDAKEVLTPMNGDKLKFPISDGTVKIFRGDQVLRTSTLIRDNPDRGEDQENLQGESEGIFFNFTSRLIVV